MPELKIFMDDNESDGKDYLLSRQLILERPNFRFGKDLFFRVLILHWAQLKRAQEILIVCWIHESLDILQPTSTRSACFTKAYGSHHVAGGGSLLQTQKMNQREYDFGDSESIADLGLRFLTPTEVARIHVFPLDERHGPTNPFEGADNSSTADSGSLTTVRPFNPRLAQGPEGPFLRFPEKLKALQRYKLLGNSLNVWVVAELLRGVLFADHPTAPRPEYLAADSNDESSISQKLATGSSNAGEGASGGDKHDITASEEGSGDKVQDGLREDGSTRESKRARVD